jgi:hypothetical protein
MDMTRIFFTSILLKARTSMFELFGLPSGWSCADDTEFNVNNPYRSVVAAFHRILRRQIVAGVASLLPISI